MFIGLIITAIFVICMMTTVIKDATTMTIPNWISLVMLGGFILITPFAWESWSVFGEHLLVGFGMFVLGFIMFALGWLGGGDAKLMAATSFWWSAADLSQYILATTVTGAILGIFLLLARTSIPAGLVPINWLNRMISEEKRMPYGLALAAGALIVLPKSEIFARAAGF